MAEEIVDGAALRPVPAMKRPATAPASRPEDAVARVGEHWFNKKQALAWLKSEQKRAEAKSEVENRGYSIRGCIAQANACKALHNRIKGWKKSDEEAALEEPLDLQAELGAIKDG